MLYLDELSEAIDIAYETYGSIDFYAAESTKKDSDKLYKQLNKEIRGISKDAKKAYIKGNNAECIRLCDEGIRITDMYLAMIPDLVSAAKESGQLKREIIVSVVVSILKTLVNIAFTLANHQTYKKLLGPQMAKVNTAILGAGTAGTVVMDAYSIKKHIDALKRGESINFNFLQAQIKDVREMFIVLKNDSKAAMNGNSAAESSSRIFVTGLNDIAINGSILGGLIDMGYDDAEACEMYVDYMV